MWQSDTNDWIALHLPVESIPLPLFVDIYSHLLPFLNVCTHWLYDCDVFVISLSLWYRLWTTDYESDPTGPPLTQRCFHDFQFRSFGRKGGKGEKTVFLFSDSQILGCIFSAKKNGTKNWELDVIVFYNYCEKYVYHIVWCNIILKG